MRTSLLLFILILSGFALSAQNKADLKLNPVKNMVYRFRSVSDQTISQTINGNQQSTSVHTNSTMSLKMVDKTTEVIVAEIHFDTLITNTNAMGVSNKFNSANEGNIKSANMSDVMSCILNRLSRNAIYAKMDYAGKVTEIVNSKMLASIMLKDTIEITGQMAPMIKSQIKNMVSDKALKTMVESFTNYLPARPVSTGESWTVDSDVNSGGMALKVMSSYTINGIKENAASITGDANIKAPDNAEPMEYSGAKITYGDLAGLSKADMVVNTLTGFIIESKGKSHITGTLSLSTQGMNMDIPMEISGEMEITTIR